MGLETGTYISDLNSANPLGTDLKSAGDDHLRLIKSTILATFPNITGAVTSTHTELNYVDVTTLGTVQASKAVTADGSGNINLGTGNLTNGGTAAFGALTCTALTSTGIDDNASSTALTIDSSQNASFTGNVTLGDASTDTVTVNGYIGVGGSGGSSTGIWVRNSALTGTTQRGILNYPVGSSAATSAINGFEAVVSTAAASFTVSNVSAYYADNATKGAGSTITNQHGLYIADQTQGTNNYGITSAVTSGANKWNIYASGTASNYFAGNVGIGTNSPQIQAWRTGATATVLGSVAGNLEVASSRGDADGVAVGAIEFAWTTNDTNHKHLAIIEAQTSGATAGQRGGALKFLTKANGTAAPTERMRIDSSGNVYGTTGTTGMTDGFFFMPAAAGAPSGTPTVTTATLAAFYYDTTNKKFYVYNHVANAWEGVTLS